MVFGMCVCVAVTMRSRHILFSTALLVSFQKQEALHVQLPRMIRSETRRIHPIQPSQWTCSRNSCNASSNWDFLKSWQIPESPQFSTWGRIFNKKKEKIPAKLHWDFQALEDAPASGERTTLKEAALSHGLGWTAWGSPRNLGVKTEVHYHRRNPRMVGLWMSIFPNM